MKILEFIEKYNLHDSLLEKSEYDGQTARLFIDFCYWQQDWYTDDMPETGNIIVTFGGCTGFYCPPFQSDSDEILSVSASENRLTLSIYNCPSDDCICITINAAAVSVKYYD